MIDVNELTSKAISFGWSWDRLVEEMVLLDVRIDPKVAIDVIASVVQENEAELGAVEALRAAVGSVLLATDVRSLPLPQASPGWQERVLDAIDDEPGPRGHR